MQASVAVAPGGSWALEHRLNSCGTQAQLCSMWGLPGPGPEPVTSALASGFFTTEPAGKSPRVEPFSCGMQDL